MKGRLGSTIWLLITWACVALFSVLGLAYHAGKESGGASLLDASSLPGSASGALLGALALAVTAALSLVFVLSKRVITPVGELARFSERLVAVFRLQPLHRVAPQRTTRFCDGNP